MENIVKIQRLIGIVSRAFYSPLEVILLDLLCQNGCMKDDELAGAVCLHVKELQKSCGKLRSAGLIKIETRWEALEDVDDARKKKAVHWYYIDYAHFVNIVKYKIYKIGKSIEKNVKVANEIFYKCSQCESRYTSLEMLTLQMTPELYPLCDHCPCVVEVEEVQDTVNGQQYALFMNETSLIVAALKETEGFAIPISAPVLPESGVKRKQVVDDVPPPTSSEIIVEFQGIEDSTALAEAQVLLQQQDEDDEEEEFIDA